MIIITSSSFISAIILTAHQMNLDIHEVDSQEVINTLDDADDSGTRCYCWTGDDKNVPEEANNMMSYKDLCAEEYEFPSLEEGDIVFVYTMVDTDEESMRAAWHMIMFDSIER
jgi:hypothetical protein